MLSLPSESFKGRHSFFFILFSSFHPFRLLLTLFSQKTIPPALYPTSLLSLLLFAFSSLRALLAFFSIPFIPLSNYHSSPLTSLFLSLILTLLLSLSFSPSFDPSPSTPLYQPNPSTTEMVEVVKVGIIIIIVVGLLISAGFLFWWIPRSFRKDAEYKKRSVNDDPDAAPPYVANVDVELQVQPSVVISMPVPSLEDESLPLPPSYPVDYRNDASSSSPPVLGYDAAAPVPGPATSSASASAPAPAATPERTA